MSRLTTAALLAVYFIWGSTYLAIRYMVTGFPPMTGTGVRFLIAGGVLSLMAARKGKKLSGRQWWAATQLGALLIVGGTGMVTVAESTGVASSLAATAVASMPLWAAIIASALGSWPSRREWLGLLVGLIGVGMLFNAPDLSVNLRGAIILLAAPASWAFGSIRSTRVDVPAGLVGVGAEMFAGGALLITIGAIAGERLVAAPPLEAWMGLAYLTVFGSIIAFSAYMYLLDTVRPALATSYAYVNPVVAVALGITLGAESLSRGALLALPFILTGVTLTTRSGPISIFRLLHNRLSRADFAPKKRANRTSTLATQATSLREPSPEVG